MSRQGSDVYKTKERPGHKSKLIYFTPQDSKRLRGIQMIIAGCVFLILPVGELYRRVYLGGERKIQEGTYNRETGAIRMFSEEEKREVFKNSWITKIFGEK